GAHRQGGASRPRLPLAPPVRSRHNEANAQECSGAVKPPRGGIAMAKLRHLAFVCKEPRKVAKFLEEAFDIQVLYYTDPPGVAVLSDGDMNFTLLPESFAEHDPVPWHFGLEMSQDEIDARREKLKEMGVA